MDFFERFLGMAPDGGDGSCELMFLLAGAVGIVLFVLKDQLRRITGKK